MNVPARFLVSTLLLLLSCGCWRKDVRVHVVHVPDLRSDREAAYIEERLKRSNKAAPKNDQDLPFYGKFDFDPEAKTLSIEYNARLHAHKNIEHDIASLGYSANGVPGDTNRLAGVRARLKIQ